MSAPARQLLGSNLVTAVATATGKPCGDAKAPLDVAPPYAVVHTISGGGYWGPGLVAPEDSADWVYQIDAVGDRRDQAEWLADKIRLTVLGRDAAGAFLTAISEPSGLRIIDRRSDGGAGGVEVEGTPPHEVYTASERYVVSVTPA